MNSPNDPLNPQRPPPTTSSETISQGWISFLMCGEQPASVADPSRPHPLQIVVVTSDSSTRNIIPFRISPEDQLIIKECNKEAFFKRCLPFSAALGSLTFIATKAGYLKPHVSWGPTPKVLAAVFFGYFAGKLSYQQICAEKLMANPNSPLGAALRARKQHGGGGFQDSLTLDMPGYTLPAEERSPDVFRDDIAPHTFTDLDTDRPSYQGLDDSFRLNVDSPQRPEDFILPPQAQTPNTYEEMRRKNREEFERKSRSFRGGEEPPKLYQPLRPSPPRGSSDSYQSTNIYGDTFDK